MLLDAAPASAQPLAAVAPLHNPHTAGSPASAPDGATTRDGDRSGKGHGPAKSHSHGPAQGDSHGPAQGDSHDPAKGNSHGSAHVKGHSAQAPGHNQASGATLNPQMALPRKVRTGALQSTPAGAAPPAGTSGRATAPPAGTSGRATTPQAGPSDLVRALGSIAIRVASGAAVDLSHPSAGPGSGVAGTVVQAVVPGGWLPGASFYRRELSLLNGSYPGASLQVARKLKLPIALLVGGALFLLVQGLVDRRDPKVSHAPEHAQDDSLGFA